MAGIIKQQQFLNSRMSSLSKDGEFPCIHKCWQTTRMRSQISTKLRDVPFRHQCSANTTICKICI